MMPKFGVARLILEGLHNNIIISKNLLLSSKKESVAISIVRIVNMLRKEGDNIRFGKAPST
jgi:hypothetical protein